MSTTFSNHGSMSSTPLSLIVSRWGSARTRQVPPVSVALGFRAGLPLVSAQCVVDDFGDLVEVRGAE